MRKLTTPFVSLVTGDAKLDRVQDALETALSSLPAITEAFNRSRDGAFTHSPQPLLAGSYEHADFSPVEVPQAKNLIPGTRINVAPPTPPPPGVVITATVIAPGSIRLTTVNNTGATVQAPIGAHRFSAELP